MTIGSNYTLHASIGYIGNNESAATASPPLIAAYLDDELLFNESVCRSASGSGGKCTADIRTHYNEFSATILAKAQDPVLRFVVEYEVPEAGLAYNTVFREVTFTLVDTAQYVEGS